MARSLLAPLGRDGRGLGVAVVLVPRSAPVTLAPRAFALQLCIGAGTLGRGHRIHATASGLIPAALSIARQAAPALLLVLALRFHRHISFVRHKRRSIHRT